MENWCARWFKQSWHVEVHPLTFAPVCPQQPRRVITAFDASPHPTTTMPHRLRPPGVIGVLDYSRHISRAAMLQRRRICGVNYSPARHAGLLLFGELAQTRRGNLVSKRPRDDLWRVPINKQIAFSGMTQPRALPNCHWASWRPPPNISLPELLKPPTRFAQPISRLAEPCYSASPRCKASR